MSYFVWSDGIRMLDPLGLTLWTIIICGRKCRVYNGRESTGLVLRGFWTYWIRVVQKSYWPSENIDGNSLKVFEARKIDLYRNRRNQTSNRNPCMYVLRPSSFIWWRELLVQTNRKWLEIGLTAYNKKSRHLGLLQRSMEYSDLKVPFGDVHMHQLEKELNFSDPGIITSFEIQQGRFGIHELDYQFEWVWSFTP